MGPPGVTAMTRREVVFPLQPTLLHVLPLKAIPEFPVVPTVGELVVGALAVAVIVLSVAIHRREVG